MGFKSQDPIFLEDELCDLRPSSSRGLTPVNKPLSITSDLPLEYIGFYSSRQLYRLLVTVEEEYFIGADIISQLEKR